MASVTILLAMASNNIIMVMTNNSQQLHYAYAQIQDDDSSAELGDVDSAAIPTSNITSISGPTNGTDDNSDRRILNLSNNSGHSNFPQITLSSNNVFVVWEDTDNAQTGNSEIYFARSQDNGNTFDEAINLSNSTGSSLNPHIVASDGNVFVVWEDTDNAQTGNSEIYFARSQDNGNNITAITNLSNSTGESLDPQISVFRDNVYAVWKDNSVGDFDIFFARSLDGGITFGEVINISTTAGNSVTPRVAASGFDVYIAWKDYLLTDTTRSEILFVSSNNRGVTFDTIMDLSNTAAAESLGPQIAVFRNNVYVVWMDALTQNSDILFVRSQNNGGTFDNTINMSNNPGESSFPKISSLGILGGNNVYVIWENAIESSGSNDIFYTSSRTNGANFPAPINVSNSTGDSMYPQIAVSPRGAVYIVWSETIDSQNSDIMLTRIK